MPGPCLPPLTEFVDLVHAVDDDAHHRVPLLAQVAPVLYASGQLSAHERAALAEKLERWRYQYLNQYGGRLTERQQRLVDLLDVAAATVLQQPVRPPKSPRTALAAAQRPTGDDRFEAALDRHTPLAAAIDWAQSTTLEHFARPAPPSDIPRRRMLLYAPLYLSSYCINHCLYCHFRYPHPLEREHLDKAAALAQVLYLERRGFRHLLLVAGDYPQLTTTGYFEEIIQACAERGLRVSVEIAPQNTTSYARLVQAGACGVTLYQETYQEGLFAQVHPRGPKHWFDWRLEGPERAAEAGASRVGLGILVGLGPVEADLRALVKHGRYLRERFPKLTLAFSLPRIHDAPDGFVPAERVDDETLLRLYCALRLAFPTAELVLSTRERPELRDRLAAICITQMSAESCTSPGGYGLDQLDAPDRQQFPVADHRTAGEIAAFLDQAGCDACWDLPESRGVFQQ